MITIIENNNIRIVNSNLKNLADEIASRVRVSMDNVVLNNFDEHTFSLGRESHFEEILSPFFKKLPTSKKDAAHILATARMNESNEKKGKRISGLKKIDLNNAVSIEKQAVPKFSDVQTSLQITPSDLLNEMHISFTKTPESFKVLNNITSINFNNLPSHPVETFQHAIESKYIEMGGSSGILGKKIKDNSGWVEYEHGAIFYCSAHSSINEVHGEIWVKYKSLGIRYMSPALGRKWKVGFLGYPISDETVTQDGIGRVSHFENGSIYWTSQTGAHEVHGAICEKWLALGKHCISPELLGKFVVGFLGYPITDEIVTAGGTGKCTHFQYGSIFWSSKTGAHEVHGEIRNYWERLGWEQSALGFPTTDECIMADGVGRYSRFQGGEIRWEPNSGAYQASSSISRISLRCIRLHCIDKTDPEYLGSDEMRMGGAIYEISPSGSVEHSLGLANLEDDWDDGDWNLWQSPVCLGSFSVPDDNNWPKGYIATCLLIEKDGGSYVDLLNSLLAELRPIIKKELEDALNSASTLLSAEIGPELAAAIAYVAGKLCGYIIDKIFGWFSQLWADDVFAPFTMSVLLPGPGALFADENLDSADQHVTCVGFGGCYEFDMDWALS